MAPLTPAAQMALANLLRGVPQQGMGGLGVEMGPPPIDSSLPGLPGADGLPAQVAMADVLAGRATQAPPPNPMGTETAPLPAGASVATEAAQQEPSADEFATSLSNALLAQRGSAAELRRQRAAGNLGLLTGDRVLSNFGQSQIDQASSGDPNSLRHLSLIQAQQRLAQQAATEERQGRQGDARLGLAERQYGTQAALGWSSLGQRRQEHADDLEQAKRAAERQRLKDIEATQDRLRGELLGNKVIKDTQEAEANFIKVEEISRNPNPANDIALIFSVMKTYDPSSTVREGEFASAQNAANVPDRIRNAFNKAKEGTILNPKQRREFVESARIYLEAQKRKAGEIAAGYEKAARDAGVDPRFVIPEGTLSGYNVQSGVPRVPVGQSLPTGADGNPTLDGGDQAPRPKAAPRPLNTEPFVYTRPAKARTGGIYMFNPKGDAFFVMQDRVEAARARGWKDVP